MLLAFLAPSLAAAAPHAHPHAPTAFAPAAPREVIPFNTGWRFQKGDPAGVGDSLAYTNIKPWILPTANAFITEKFTPRGPAARPEGTAPGANLPITGGAFDDSGWRLLDLPHDWGVEGPFRQNLPAGTGKLEWWGVAWYRKTFDLPAADAARRVVLELDGAMAYSTVWLNGQLIGGWPYGYSSYQLDLTPHIQPGKKNTLAIRLDNPPRSSRWYPGGGIYRNVRLVKTNPVHVAQWGTRITTPKATAAEATVVVETEVTNDSAAHAHAEVTTEIIGAIGDKPENRVLKRLAAATKVVHLDAGQTGKAHATLTLKNPELWDIKPRPGYPAPAPHLYTARTTIRLHGKIVDQYSTPFGVRDVKFTADNGLLLNGERVQLKGVCNHHDLGALGTAVHTTALRRQLLILQAMGCNAIRTSHNPPAPELLHLADTMGFLILDEYADMWERGKVGHPYSKVFQDWSEADLRTLIKRDRNHPSVIAWSTGNEVGEQRGGAHALATAQRLTDIAHDADPTRPTTTANNSPGSATNGFQKTSDLYGYNYKPHNYHTFRKANPTIPVYGSETASCISTRGEYFFPVSRPNTPAQNAAIGGAPQANDRPSNTAGEIEKGKGHGRSDFQVSSYDLSAPPWAYPPDVEFGGLDSAPFVAGEFVWTGFDYLGEPTPYGNDASELLNFHNAADRARAAAELKRNGKLRVPSRSSYFGIVDLAGFPKDRYYIYQARWRPDYPMAHILPHWNWPERIGQITPVHVYSAADEAELFLNGKSLGRKKRAPREYRFRWDDVRYAPGELKVVTWKAGKPWADAATKTTGPAAKLELVEENAGVEANGDSLIYAAVRVVDAAGLVVPRSKNPIKFTLAGPGEIVATDNGDPTDHTAFKSHSRKAFNGLAQVIFRVKRSAKGNENAQVLLRAESDGLVPGELNTPQHFLTTGSLPEEGEKEAAEASTK
jgi:beta-galactosidase